MTHDATSTMLTVIYAADIERVAEFYATTLSWPIVEREPGFIIVGRGPAEIAVVAMSANALGASTIAGTATSPRVREDTAIKPSFLVADLEFSHLAATASGGGTRPPGAAWGWRGQLHLDGYDPEGNAVQFRALDAE